MQNNDGRVLGFVSHRCKEYDEAPWRTDFENFLMSKGITPSYGCCLDTSFKGILSSNIQKAMKNSDIYIAVITESWQKAEKEGWPKREWEMWHEINKYTDDKKERCFGFLIDIQRSKVQFIQDLMSYKISSSVSSEH